jgi:hypothetical protein
LSKGRGPFRAAAAALAALSLAGCASIRGTQEPVTKADLQSTLCPTAAEVDQFDGLAGVARRNFRDKVVLSCVKAIDRRYADFRADLQREQVGTSLVTGIASQSLSTAAALGTGGAAKTLAGVSSLITGVGASINKDVFYQQTLPAIEASMDARRTKILTSIINAENADPEAQRYTLERAGFDLSEYAAAGDLYAAIGELTKTATAAAASANASLAQAKQQQPVAYLAKALQPANYTALRALTDKVRALNASSDRAKLDAVAKTLGLTPSSDQNFEDEQVSVINTIVMQASSAPTVSDENAAVQSLQSKLAPLLP